MNIKPVFDHVVVKMVEAEETTKRLPKITKARPTIVITIRSKIDFGFSSVFSTFVSFLTGFLLYFSFYFQFDCLLLN